MKPSIRVSVLLLTVSMAALAGAPAAAPSRQWAQPLEVSGVPNLHKVSPWLYRSAQPTAAGMRNLQGLGIKTVVNLRTFHSDRDLVRGTRLHYQHIYMQAWDPEEDDVVRFLRVVTDPRRLPVLVHCQHGADRTGLLVAAYRVAVQGWSKEEALEEMVQGGFGFHGVWENLIVWFNRLDMGRIRKEMKKAPGKEPGPFYDFIF
jgi:protein-tyrosine phosphatase